MKLLIIGGTGFLGRHLVEAALARGHELTLFNRGQRHPDLFADIEQIHGKRDGEITQLKGRHWDVVIDTCGYFPRVVQASAETLSQTVERYIFISSISVYANFNLVGINEHSPVATLQDETIEEITNESYGALKALCEQVVEKTLPGRTLNIRPGFIVGPFDHTDRFTYWPFRVAQGGKMLAPGSPDQPVQVIDVRDLASWTIHMAEERKTGNYNATGPDYPLPMGELLESSKTVTGSDVELIWVSEDFLTAHEIDLPIWAPLKEYAGFHAVDCTKAIKDGLTFRPIAETIRDTLAWKSTTEPAPLRAGLQTEQEKQLLEEWLLR